jgi:four helix bundle suffix protein
MAGGVFLFLQHGPARTDTDGKRYVLAANAALAVINLAEYCLARQINVLCEQFEMEGGISERLYNARIRRRNRGLQ